MFDRPPVAVINSVWQKIPFNIKAAFFSAFIIGVLTHVFMLTNKLPNHDEFAQIVGNPDHAFAGRWFLQYPAAISSIFSMPWVNGLLSVTYISIAACLAVSLIKIKKGIYCGLVAGLMVTVPTVASTMTYMQLSDAYFFALMLSCFAAFLAERYKYGFIAAVVPITLSLGVYQSYYGVTAGLMILILIMEVLRDKTPAKKTLFKGMRFAGALIAGVAIYLVIVRLTAPPTGLSANQAIDQIGQISPSDIPFLLRASYWWVAAYFLLDVRNFHFPFMPIVFIVTFLLCAILLVLWCTRKKVHKKPPKMVLLIVLLILFPLGCNIIYVMGAAWVHDLMVYGTVLIPVFMLAVVDLYTVEGLPKLKKGLLHAKVAVLSCWILTAVAALCIFNYWITSNQAYIKLSYGYEQAYAQSLLLLSRIQALDEYTGDTGVVLVGTPRLENGIPELNQITITAAYGIELFGNWSYPYFLRRYLNFTQEVIFLRDGVVRDPAVAAIISELPLYPDSGSVVYIDGMIYVNFAVEKHDENNR